MAVSDHLKIASTELLKAADLVKLEIENLRKQTHDFERSLSERVADRTRRISTLESELRRAGDSWQRSQLQGAIHQTQREIADMRTQLRAQQQNMDNIIRQKSGLVTGLQSQARAIPT
jgi:predicted  nucleic acid-binding Zn-ribbon protein